MTGAPGWRIPARARRFRSRFISFPDRGSSLAASLQPSADGSEESGRTSGSIIALARGPRVTSRRRRRSVFPPDNASEVIEPTMSATETNTPPSASIRKVDISISSVLNIDELPDDDGSDHLQDYRADDHPHTKWISRENADLPRVGDQHERGDRRRHRGQDVGRHAAVCGPDSYFTL